MASSSSSSSSTQKKASSTVENQGKPSFKDALGNQSEASGIRAGEIPEGYKLTTEGTSGILTREGNQVFYNEVQEKNRDLSILVLNEFSKQLVVESAEKIARKEIGVPRKKQVPATRTTWGGDFARKLPPENLQEVDDGGNTTKDGAKDDSGKEAKDASNVSKLRKKFEASRKKRLEQGAEGLQKLRILEALAASGLRSIRYLKEITDGIGIDQVVINDIEPTAVETIKKNLEYNGLGGDERVRISCSDASTLMHQHREETGKDNTRMTKALKKAPKGDPDSSSFDVIDLDPYGSPSPFMDAAVQAVRDGGMLCVTATDLRTLLGKVPDNTYSSYRVMPLPGARFGHEFAIRELLAFMQTTAGLYGREIVPLLSVKMDFYVRVFVRVYDRKANMKEIPCKLGYILHSTQCDDFYVQPLGEHEGNKIKTARFVAPAQCSQTGTPMRIGGPIWTDPIHNFEFVESLLETFKSEPAKGSFDSSSLKQHEHVLSLLVAISEELPDAPLCMVLSNMCKTLHCSVPPNDIVMSAIMNAGFQVSRTHLNATELKTNAPCSFVWDILKEWVKKQPVSKKHLEDPESVTAKILATPMQHVIDFKMNPDVRRRQQDAKNAVSKWRRNPKPNWGPKPAANGRSRRQTHPRGKRSRNATSPGEKSTNKKSRKFNHQGGGDDDDFEEEKDWKSF